MTDEQIKRQIQAIKDVTKEACKTKESARQFLIDAGIIPYIRSNSTSDATLKNSVPAEVF